MCSSKEPPAETGLTSKAFESLKIGSTTIIVEAPKMLKTTTSLPCLIVNSGLVKADDVGSALGLTVHVSRRSFTIILQLVKELRPILQLIKSSFQLEWRSMCSTAASMEWNWVMNKAGMQSGMDCRNRGCDIKYGCLWCIRY
ncbi:unnamed protein product [Lactuca saligna]|uniref:Uncharacterized protein n=1 Tax=Lactuca saligna TaxID=75948 RepID=A0AA36EBW0_LACSI|nr:unnamed protein product [Lactuca saligna]